MEQISPSAAWSATCKAHWTLGCVSTPADINANVRRTGQHNGHVLAGAADAVVLGAVSDDPDFKLFTELLVTLVPHYVGLMVVGGLLLFMFGTSMVLGQAMTAATHLPAVVTVGGPACLFAITCVAVWVSSRDRPGENPVNWLSEKIAEQVSAVILKVRPSGAANSRRREG